MKNLKSLAIGAGVTLFNIGGAFIQVFKPEKCTGSCGSCGFTCGQTVVGLVGIGTVVILWKKIKEKLVKKSINLNMGQTK